MKFGFHARHFASTQYKAPIRNQVTTSATLLARRTASSRPFTMAARSDSKVIVKVPTMAGSMKEGTLISLVKKIGDQVEANEKMASIETRKFHVSIKAPEAGVVAEILTVEGDVLSIGHVIAILETKATEFKGKEGTSTKESMPLQLPKPTDPWGTPAQVQPPVLFID